LRGIGFIILWLTMILPDRISDIFQNKV
jgi:hypothetical protein